MPASTRVAPLIIAGVLVVATVVLGVLGHPSLAVLAGLAAVVAVVVTGRMALAERRRRQSLAADLEATHKALTQTADRARQWEDDRQQRVAETRRLAEALRGRWSAPAAQPLGAAG